MITITGGKLHWNYFLALERDLETASRFIEFCEPNLAVFSIELAHLLFAAASEVDVLAKCICELIEPAAKRYNINDYRRNITQEESRHIQTTSTALVPNPLYIKKISAIKVRIPRYGLSFIPWENWANNTNPFWWLAYNNVKHQRDQHFDDATLKNAINALGALLIMNFYYYRLVLTAKNPRSRWQAHARSITRQLEPQSTFLQLPEDYYDVLRREE